MEIFATTILILGALTGLEWIVRNLLALKVWRSMFHLREDYAESASADLEKAPAVSVVIAAKDEEHHIGACVESVLKQDYPNFEVVVIDDRSDDRTAEIVREISRRDSRVRLIQVVHLPAGWCGKNHAMQRGIETVENDYILMTDADCRFTSTKTISAAMKYLTDNDADMLSLIPDLEMKSFWEHMLQPVLGGILMIWFPPDKVCNPKKPHAFANGQFMLMNRKSYQQIGSHEAIKGSLIEDMDLARGIKRSGRKLLFRQSEGLFSVRMYSSRAQIVRGWVRIFTGVFQHLGAMLKALGVLWGRGLTPTVTTILSWSLLCATGNKIWLSPSIACSVGLLFQLIMMYRYYKFNKAGKFFGLIYPFTSFFCGTILIRAMLTLREGANIIWRDTVYQADQGKTKK